MASRGGSRGGFFSGSGGGFRGKSLGLNAGTNKGGFGKTQGIVLRSGVKGSGRGNTAAVSNANNTMKTTV